MAESRLSIGTLMLHAQRLGGVARSDRMLANHQLPATTFCVTENPQ
jgi:hypothetical protein